jgi:hypothetical protein
VEMFDEIETTIRRDGTAEVKHTPAEETIAELDFQTACDQFVKAEKNFHKLDLTVRLHASADACDWFDALEARYLAEKKVWEIFTGGHRSPRMGRLYLEFRDSLIRGESLKPNA